MKKIFLCFMFVFYANYANSAAFAGEPLPIGNRQIVIDCAIKMAKAIDAVTPQEEQLARRDPTLHMSLIKRMLVDPIIGYGYDYDKSVVLIAQTAISLKKSIEANKTPSDIEYAQAVLFITRTIYTSAHLLLAYGFITPETRQSLVAITSL